MTLTVLELNDSRMTLGDATGILARSPACLLHSDDAVLFGQDAAAGSRLDPGGFHSRFWHALGMEPLPRPVGQFRHHADMAHAHLQHLAESAGLGGDGSTDVIVLAPGSFSREQLAMLLGIMRHSPLRPVALVDTAVIAGAGAARAGSLRKGISMHLDMHLHEMVLSIVTTDDDRVHRERLVALPDLGWQQIEEAMASLVTDAFIRQARFNPQHSARWEQYLHDQLPQWLDTDSETLEMAIDSSDGARHQVRLPRAALEQRLEGLYRQIIDSAPQTADMNLIIARPCARLPGLEQALTAGLGDSTRLHKTRMSSEQLLETALGLSQRLIRDEPGSLRFITSLPLEADVSSRRRHAPAQPEAQVPSHLLSGSDAWPVADGLVCHQEDDGLIVRRGGPDTDTESAGVVRVENGSVVLRCSGERLRVNGQPARGEVRLSTGDRIDAAVNGQGEPLRLIRVHDGKA